MKPYVKTYINHFKDDFIACEVCGKQGVDIHHIYPRSTHKHLENDINNLMALCRECHNRLGDRKQHRDFLIERHKLKLEQLN